MQGQAEAWGIVAQTGYGETCATNKICKIRTKYTRQAGKQNKSGLKNKINYGSGRWDSPPSFPLRVKEHKKTMTSKENWEESHPLQFQLPSRKSSWIQSPHPQRWKLSKMTVISFVLSYAHSIAIVIITLLGNSYISIAIQSDIFL